MNEIYTGKIPQRSFIEQFFTFLIPVENIAGSIYRFKWQTEAALKQNWKRYREQEQQFSQWCDRQDSHALVRELLRIYQQDSTPISQQELAKWHLAAYLEDPLYQAARDRFKAFKDYDSPSTTWEHYLHIAKCLACEPERVAAIYHRHKPAQYSLEQHFRLEFASKIRDIFYQETGRGKYSPWFALKRTSEGELKRALLKITLEASEISCYLAAKNSLFAVYSKCGKRWLEPTLTQYQEATQYFNRHYVRTECANLSSDRPIDLDKFQMLIKVCLQAIQASPTVESLDAYGDRAWAPESSNPEGNFWLEDPLTNLEQQQSAAELQTWRDKIDAILSDCLQQLEEVDRDILRLCSLGLKQTQVAKQIGVNQGTVSRRYQRCQRTLLKALASFLQEQFPQSLSTTEALAHLEEYIFIWLKRQYKVESSDAEDR